MGRPKKSKTVGPPAPQVPEEGTKYFVEAHEHDQVFGLDEVSDMSDTDVVPSRNPVQKKKMRGEDFVGTIDMDTEHVFDLDVPTDSDISDADKDFVDEGQRPRSSARWGNRRNVFYNADDTFADEEAAQLEEQEAISQRKQRLQNLNEADFLDDSFGNIINNVQSATTFTASSDLNRPPISSTDPEVIEQRPRSELTADQMMEFLASTSPDLLEFIMEYTQHLDDLKDVLFPMFALAHHMEPIESPVYLYLSTKYYAVLGLLLNITFYLSLYAKGYKRKDIIKHPVVNILVRLKKQLESISEFESSHPWLMERLEPLISATEDMDDLDMDVSEYIAHVAKELQKEDNECDSGEDSQSSIESDMDSGSEYGSDSGSESNEFDDNEEDRQRNSRNSEDTLNMSKRKRSTEQSSDTSSEIDQEFGANLASLPPKRRRVLEAKLNDMKNSAFESDFLNLTRVVKASKCNSHSSPAIDADFDESAPDAQVDHPQSKSRSLKKLVQSVRTGSKSKPNVSADSDVARPVKKAQALNSHLSKGALTSADRAATQFSDDDHDGGEGTSGKVKHVEPNFNTIGINLDKVDSMRPITSLIAAQAQRAQRKAIKLAKKSGGVIHVPEPLPAEKEMDSSVHAKRKATYSILKNRGLTPKRKKEDRNPRVKHRRKFETKIKKLKTVARLPTSLKAGYQGELTGIKTHLTRQVNLN